MRIILLVQFLFLMSFANAQDWIQDHYKYDTHSKMMTGYYQRGQYFEAINYIDSLDGNQFLVARDYFMFARITSLANEFDKTLRHLEKAVKGGYEKKDIATMYDLDKFRESSYNMMFELNYNEWNKSSIQPKLDSSFIKLSGEMHQRALIARYDTTYLADGDEIYEQKDSLEAYTLGRIADSLNFIQLSNYIDQNGFPRARDVGVRAMWKVLGVLNYWMDGFDKEKSRWSNIKKEINKKIEEKQVKPFFLAMLEDSYRLENNQPSKYATNIGYYRQANLNQNEYKVEDIENLNIRRKGVGLCAIQIEIWSKAMDFPTEWEDVNFK